MREFGYVQCRDRDYSDRRMLQMELQGRSQRGGAKKSFMDVVREKKMQRTVRDDKDKVNDLLWRLL